MTSAEWTALLSIILAIAVPAIGAGMAVFVQLTRLKSTVDTQHQVVVEKISRRDRYMRGLGRQIRELWRVHNHQEARIFVQDRAISMLLDHAGIEFELKPKERPHFFDGDQTEGGGIDT